MLRQFFLAILASNLLGSCISLGLSVEEAKLAGDWEQLTIEGPLHLNLRRDHTFVATGGIAEGPMHGWWRVTRNQLMLRLDNPLIPDSMPMNLTQFRQIYRRVSPPRDPNPSNHAMQRTAGRSAFQLSTTSTIQPAAARAVPSGR